MCLLRRRGTLTPHVRGVLRMRNWIALAAVLLLFFPAHGRAGLFDNDVSSSPVAPGPPSAPNTKPSGVAPSSNVAPRAAARLPIPAASAQADAGRLMRDVLHDDFIQATTPDRKIGLARKLMETAAETKDDAAQSFVLYKTAGDLAISGGDLEEAEGADRKLRSMFDVDPLTLNVERFEAAAKTAKQAADFALVAKECGQWFDAQQFDRQMELSQRLVTAGNEMARKSGDPMIAARWAQRAADQKAIQAAYLLVKPSLATLEKTPADPAANLAAGKYYCFILGDWDKGLPLLALCSDGQLQALAAEEVSPSANPVEVGDRWWDLAEHEVRRAQQNIRFHAADWYRVGQATATGAERARLERRIALVEPLLAASARTAQSVGSRMVPGKLLLIVDHEEQQIAEEACKKYGLSYDVIDSFDAAREDYRGYSTILCGSNKMMYWKTHKSPEDFQYIDAFVEGGGHLVVFGSFNADGDFQLERYGIHTSYYHGSNFAPSPGKTELLMAGNEDLLPHDGLLHSAGNFKCSSPHVVLLNRVKKTGEPDGPLMITMPWKRGRITFNIVEPNWKQPHDALWLLTATINWISRGSPMGKIE